jgi:hypothetical protein
MKERPILFNGAMVQALLAGTKTQTRRVAQPKRSIEPMTDECPHGKPRDRLWVRETWARPDRRADNLSPWIYAADYAARPLLRWKPSIHMPRWASRITLEITDVRVERLQDISEADAIAEGVVRDFLEGDKATLWRNYATSGTTICPVFSYQTLWESINGPGSWDANPWVWTINFKRLQ